jgi:signal transduction histidine kinase
MRVIARRLIRPPLRLRITMAATASIAVILVTLSMFVYGRLRGQLLQALDSGLQARAEAIASAVGSAAPLGQVLADRPDARLATATQILTPGGRILVSTGSALPQLSARFLRDLSGPVFTQVTIRARAGPIREYALPVNEGRPLVILVASGLSGVNRTLASLELLLLIGDPAALALASVVAYVMTGAALRPVERMRREAAAISATDPAMRLPVPATNDEVARLGETLNSLLERLQTARDHERRLLDDASHELRTPLSALKAGLDLALSRHRPAAELEEALRSASDETNRLARLAQDLLVLSRSRDEALTARRVSTGLGELLGRACARHQATAAQANCLIVCDAPDLVIMADPMRLTQAIDNVLDNAIRYSGGGGTIHVRAEVTDAAITIAITNPGPGFPAQIIGRAFEPFVSGSQSGAGLGLAIVRAVAKAHGGWATASNVPGGARVAMTLTRDHARAAGYGHATSGLQAATTD